VSEPPPVVTASPPVGKAFMSHGGVGGMPPSHPSVGMASPPEGTASPPVGTAFMPSVSYGHHKWCPYGWNADGINPVPTRGE